MSNPPSRRKSVLAPMLIPFGIALLAGLLSLGVYRFLGPKADTPAPKMEKNAIAADPLQFRLDAPGVKYFYIDWQRGMSSAKNVDSIPSQARAAVAVLSPEVADSSEYYVADLLDKVPGDEVTARPISAAEFQALAEVVAQGSFLGSDIALASSGLTLDIAEGRLNKRKKQKKSKTIQRLNKYPSFRIPGVF